MLGSVAGCGTNRSSFVSEANETCQRYADRIDHKSPPKTPRQGIAYAIGYYTELDLAVSTLRGMRLPAADATRLRRDWLHPAQRALVDYRPQLDAMRTASNADDGPRVDALLAGLHRLPGTGVDGAYLGSLGLTRCRTLFTST